MFLSIYSEMHVEMSVRINEYLYLCYAKKKLIYFLKALLLMYYYLRSYLIKVSRVHFLTERRYMHASIISELWEY
jgi:hypothetical protein